MADGYYLTSDDVQLLRRMADLYRKGEWIEQRGEGLPKLPPRSHHFAAMTTSEGVDAYVDPVAGYANVTLCTISTSGLVENTTYTVRAYNLSTSPVQANTVVQIKREEKTGKFMIDFENCS